MKPGKTEFVLVVGMILATRIALKDGLEQGFGGDHAGFHGGVGAFYLGKVKCSRIATHQNAAR